MATVDPKGFVLTICLVVLIGIVYTILHFGNHTKLRSQTFEPKNLVSSLSYKDEYGNVHADTKEEKQNICRMENCFDFEKCNHGFKVYVYPFEDGERVSANYAKIIHVIKKSVYYTDNPTEACLFVPSYDTTDQDKLSKDFVTNLGEKLLSLPHWNGGRNHVIFNIYSGTWALYKETLDFDIGQAILVKASFNAQHYRPNFDISLPLFDQNEPLYSEGNLPRTDKIFPVLNRYKVAFKGKRYLGGIGGESRASLHHIHNNDDIIMLTTCRHGKNWEDMKDNKCDHDNELYDRYDYNDLMGNATFCLIPRGRRLGSYRFLEALESGCIPLLLSNGWVLPFAEKIDWQKASVQADERILTLIPTIVREFTREKIFEMKQQVLFLWNAYFSSIDKIVHTVLKIIHSRINKHMTKQYFIWNTFPGGLHISPSYSKDLKDYPFYYTVTGHQVPSTFTAIIYANSSYLRGASPLYTLIQNVAKSPFVAKIVVLWTAKESIPSKELWPLVDVTIAVQRLDRKKGESRMTPRSLVTTDVVLSLDEDVNLNVDEINFAFQVWRQFPDRIVGFPCRNHYLDKGLSTWFYSSNWSNKCSMILTSAAFYHRYYNHYYAYNLPPSFHTPTLEWCQDIVLNFIVSHITRKPPVKVLDNKPYKKDIAKLYTEQSATKEHFTRFERRRSCFKALVEEFGYMPLLETSVRFDPVLYKDPVSNFRKKYRLLEV